MIRGAAAQGRPPAGAVRKGTYIYTGYAFFRQLPARRSGSNSVVCETCWRRTRINRSLVVRRWPRSLSTALEALCSQASAIDQTRALQMHLMAKANDQRPTNQRLLFDQRLLLEPRLFSPSYHPRNWRERCHRAQHDRHDWRGAVHHHPLDRRGHGRVRRPCWLDPRRNLRHV